jgi:hypothetical protein
MTPRLALARHRATTAHLASAYPFLAEAGLGGRGVYLGTNLLTGGGGFAYDPFEAYTAGILTNPNVLIAGEPGVGKSALTKAFLARSVAVFGRWCAIADPKGEYDTLAAHLGLTRINLHPGGTARLNPLDPPPVGGEDPHETARRQTTMVCALLAHVLGRALTPLEDAVCGWAITELARTRARGHTVTLADLAALLAEPTAEMAARARTTPADLARSAEPATYALGKLLDRSLRGMFDGPTTIGLDADGPGVVVDLSAVHHDPDALTLVMVAATAWLQAVLARPDSRRRIQVLDEAWALLGTPHTARYLQACWKLCRAYGVANVAVVHRLSDLRAQADDGTTTAKVTAGLLADTQTRVLFRQAADQIPDARTLLGLTPTEATLLTRLVKGRALWKIGGRSAVVHHSLSATEAALCDTDAAMVNL